MKDTVCRRNFLENVVKNHFSARAKENGEWDCHKEASLKLIKENGAHRAFPSKIWEMLDSGSSGLQGKKILVPSSGDNFVVFAFSLLGANVTSTDFSKEMLANAECRANEHNFSNIEFKQADTMALDNLSDSEYDFIFTSNGVYNCLNDIQKVHNSFFRVLKPDGIYCFYENHPLSKWVHEDPNGKCQKCGNILIFEVDSYKTFNEKDSLGNFYRIEDYINSLAKADFVIKDYCDIHREEDSIPILTNYLELPSERNKLPAWIGIRAKKPNTV